MPSACRLSQTLGVCGLVALGHCSGLGLPRFRTVSLLCKTRLLARPFSFAVALSVAVSVGRPSRFAGGQRTALCLPSVSAHGRRAMQPGWGLPREQDRKLRPCRFGRSSICLRALHAASSLAAFEATMRRHANAFKRKAFCQRHRRLGLQGKEVCFRSAA